MIVDIKNLFKTHHYVPLFERLSNPGKKIPSVEGGEKVLFFGAVTLFAFAFSLFALPFLFHVVAFAFAKLVGEFVDDFVDSLGAFAEDVRAGNGKVNFDGKGFGRRGGLIVPEDDVGAHDLVGDMFEVGDFVCHVGVDGTSHLKMTCSEMDVHEVILKKMGTLCRSKQ